MNTNATSSYWLQKALDDLRWTEANIRESIYYGACFTAQQAVEKALKAYLLSQGKNVRKVHDIAALLEECGKFDATLLSLRDTLLPLVDYYIQTRYPDAGEFIGYTKEKADDALVRARKILDAIQQRFDLSK